jgi:hypothetical protein
MCFYMATSTAVLAGSAVVRKLQALMASGVHAVVFPRRLSTAGYMHLLAATRPVNAIVTEPSPELLAACQAVGLLPDIESTSDLAENSQEFASSAGLTLPMEPVGMAPFRGVRISGAKLANQVQITRHLLKDVINGEALIATSGTSTCWVVDALALNCEARDAKEELVQSLSTKKVTLLADAAAMQDLHEALTKLDAATRRKLKSNVQNLIIDAPLSSMNLAEFTSFVGRNRSIWGARVVYRVRLPHLGSVALMNAEFTAITARAPGVQLRVGAGGELFVRSPGAVASRPSDRSHGRYIRSGVAMRLTADVGQSLFRGFLGAKSRQSELRKPIDHMRPNWQTIKQVPVRLLRKRRGSKGQIYLTDKSQVSAFYRPRYFRSTGRKSRAVVRGSRR